jgi:hypothetical protein
VCIKLEENFTGEISSQIIRVEEIEIDSPLKALGRRRSKRGGVSTEYVS